VAIVHRENAFLEIGAYRIRSRTTGRFRLRATAFAPSRFSVADDEGRIPLVTRALVLEGPAGRVLFDPGLLTEPGEKAELGARGVDHVVLSHLHHDHAGGAFHSENGRTGPTFAGAALHVQRRNVEEALRALEAGEPGYRKREIEGLGAGAVVEADGAGEILPGIATFVSDGHVAGMQGLRVRAAGAMLLAPADLLPTLAHLRLPGSGEYDRDGAALDREKRQLIEEALREEAWIFLFHDPRHVAVRIGGSVERPIVREEVAF
jgi:glyoxylase-like metal-dependent hydrolase (beta-lactamase superfamily II)